MVTVLMGTNANAANIIDESMLGNIGSRSDPRDLWSYLVCSLDRPTINSVKLRKTFRYAGGSTMDFDFQNSISAYEHFLTLTDHFTNVNEHKVFIEWLFASTV